MVVGDVCGVVEVLPDDEELDAFETNGEILGVSTPCQYYPERRRKKKTIQERSIIDWC